MNKKAKNQNIIDYYGPNAGYLPVDYYLFPFMDVVEVPERNGRIKFVFFNEKEQVSLIYDQLPGEEAYDRPLSVRRDWGAKRVDLGAYDKRGIALQGLEPATYVDNFGYRLIKVGPEGIKDRIVKESIKTWLGPQSTKPVDVQALIQEALRVATSAFAPQYEADKQKAVVAAIKKFSGLSEKERHVFILRVVDKMSLSEIAARLHQMQVTKRKFSSQGIDVILKRVARKEPSLASLIPRPPRSRVLRQEAEERQLATFMPQDDDE